MTEELNAETLGQMRRFSDATPHTRWAAYRNADLGHPDLGHLRFLATGPGCTFKDAPACYPDTPQHGIGWRYTFEGYLDLETGEIAKEEHPSIAEARRRASERLEQGDDAPLTDARD